ncbi:CDK5 regulatory subunit-associated protein 3 isoform X3 [Pararge aegeria]|uniref:CDK5 regulatory subunit-associated protein 3 isoform X3 n=1 Tax=Pararge aegeria TaxID=116150 RepID=UPI0019D01E7B|nr:CDK5 regulatory subunit-associated protein 3 isoform X3 [Pararge aegeria]
MDESNIPIDINIGKLQDWLVSRRHVHKEWQKNIIAVREKINSAIQDMPAHEDIAALLTGSHINYFHCLKIIEILKETEADTKNLFGRYGSQRMKDWQDLVRSYEKDNLYLAEAAQIFVRNINYEIPGFKKQIAKEEQMQTDCEKKHSDYLKNEASSKSEFMALCKQLGIKGDKIKRELVERLQELPEIYDKIGESLKPLQPAIDLYSAFTKYILGDQASDLLPLLQYVVQHGNTTVYQWSYGEPPLSIEPDPIHIELEDDTQGSGDQIDFGDSAVIDFESADVSAEIDFGDGDAGGEIDWGNIETVTDVTAPDAAPASPAESGMAVRAAGGGARGRDALSVLDCAHTRSRFLDQLLELTPKEERPQLCRSARVSRRPSAAGVVPEDAAVRDARGQREPVVLAHRAAAQRERGGAGRHAGRRAGGRGRAAGAASGAAPQRQALAQGREGHRSPF